MKIPKIELDIANEITSFNVLLESASVEARKALVALVVKLESKIRAELLKIDGLRTLRDMDGLLRFLASAVNDLQVQGLKVIQKEVREAFSESIDHLRDLWEDLLFIKTASINLPIERTNQLIKRFYAEGNSIEDLWTRFAARQRLIMEREIKIGFTNSENPKVVTRRILQRGLKNRANISTVVQTALNRGANQARLEFLQSRPECKLIFAVATLDGKTTDICIQRDGKVWTIDGQPVGHGIPFAGGPPFHPNCRTAIAPKLDLNHKAFKNIPPRQRASMFGPVDAELDYPSWLASLSDAQKKAILENATNTTTIKKIRETLRKK